jgi:hypothetical protein
MYSKQATTRKGDGVVLVHDVINMSFVVGRVKSNSDTATVGNREIRTVSVRQ